MTYPDNEERTKSYLNKFNREKVLRSLVNSGNPLIFDVGANNGTSLVEFKNFWPESNIHCFEPQPICWDKLDETSKRYKQGSIFINKFALGNETLNEKQFYSHDISSGISGFHKINLESKDSINLSEIKNDKKLLSDYSNTVNHETLVKVRRADEYIIKNNLDRINLLKMDTQGFEPEILDGLGNQLQNIDVIISEIMFYDLYEKKISFYDLEKYLIPNGFKLYDISHISKNPQNGRTDWVDVIYINENI